MERVKTIGLRRTVVGATVCVLALIGWSGPALASPPSVTLSGSNETELGPEGRMNFVEVSATLSDGVVNGVLHDEDFGVWHTSISLTGAIPARRALFPAFFTGSVTCMAVRGNRVTVGALGTAEEEGRQLPGTYTQLLTVEFGEFRLKEVRGPKFATDTYGVPGGSVLSARPPNCHDASFSEQNVPEIYWTGSVGGHIHISPSITSPRDGQVSRNGTVTLSGTGEPNRALKVYEVGNEASAKEVTASTDGEWSVTLNGLSPGKHVFTASAVNGSTVSANTVEIDVLPRPGEWTIVPRPNPGSSDNSLNGVSCISARRCVAVGAVGGRSPR